MCRPAEANDFASFRSAHIQMFPVDYEDTFYDKAVKGQDHLQSLVAVERY